MCRTVNRAIHRTCIEPSLLFIGSHVGFPGSCELRKKQGKGIIYALCCQIYHHLSLLRFCCFRRRCVARRTRVTMAGSLKHSRKLSANARSNWRLSLMAAPLCLLSALLFLRLRPVAPEAMDWMKSMYTWASTYNEKPPPSKYKIRYEHEQDESVICTWKIQYFISAWPGTVSHLIEACHESTLSSQSFTRFVADILIQVTSRPR